MFQGFDANGTLASLGQFLPILLIFGVFYVMLIRPQQVRQRELKTMLGALRRGDRVITAGGILGTVQKVEDTELDVEIATGVRVTVLRETVTGVVKPKVANDTKPAKKAS